LLIITLQVSAVLGQGLTSAFYFLHLLIEFRLEHDKGFRFFLSDPKIFADFLKAFIKAPWTTLVKPENLELINADFILPTFEKRSADIIYCLTDPESRRYKIYF
jgi:hypothetical protein